MKLQIGLPLMFIGRSTIFVYANGVNITNNISISHNKDYVEKISLILLEFNIKLDSEGYLHTFNT